MRSPSSEAGEGGKTQPYVVTLGADHDDESVRESIARGRAQDRRILFIKIMSRVKSLRFRPRFQRASRHTSSRGCVVAGCRDARHHHAHRGRSRSSACRCTSTPCANSPSCAVRPRNPLSPVCEASRETHEADRTPDLGFAPRREPGAPRGVSRIRARARHLERGGARPAPKPRRRDPPGNARSEHHALAKKKSAEATTDPRRPLLPSTDPWQHVFWTGAGRVSRTGTRSGRRSSARRVDAMNAERQATNARFMESIVKGRVQIEADDESEPAPSESSDSQRRRLGTTPPIVTIWCDACGRLRVLVRVL